VLSALPWRTLAIEVKRITPVAKPLEGRNVFEVEAALLAADGSAELHAGLQGSAHLVAGSAPLVWNLSRRLVDALRLAAWECFG
jgi:hypothetical protein